MKAKKGIFKSKEWVGKIVKTNLGCVAANYGYNIRIYSDMFEKMFKEDGIEICKDCFKIIIDRKTKEVTFYGVSRLPVQALWDKIQKELKNAYKENIVYYYG